ncbi:helix-turn-helix transcriptional regulator [Metabacillus indicus]|uniref:helix-turn-helix domain-containing protein n=1 Tax=Metabacillus indicus TaxID=246786 RepID=UPI002A02826E|nr:helix-turn-helix transcriptional regulator [Metabacillus indicus]MDX8288865.1 helix-turn-helix transcriptional regulator [Metabacillus indicus]
MSDEVWFKGFKLKEIRKERNFTQEELAEVVNVSGSYISKIENGEQMPSMKVLNKITQAMRVSPKDFF